MRSAFVLLVAAVVCSTGQSAAPPVPAFRHVVVVVFENHEYGKVLGNPEAPASTRSRRKARCSQSYRAVRTRRCRTTSRWSPARRRGSRATARAARSAAAASPTRSRRGRRGRRTPRACRHRVDGPSRGGYAKKHVPFLYFRRVLERAGAATPDRAVRRSSRATSRPAAAQLLARRPGPLPRHARLLCRDGRRLAQAFLPPLLKLPRHCGLRRLRRVRHAGAASRRSRSARWCGPLVLPGVISHYGLLRMIEQGFGLPLLGRSARRRPSPASGGVRVAERGICGSALKLRSGRWFDAVKAIEARDPFTQGHARV